MIDTKKDVKDGQIGFFDEYRFLSNFHLCPIELDGVVYGSLEAAYQAAKCLYPEDRSESLVRMRLSCRPIRSWLISLCGSIRASSPWSCPLVRTWPR